MNLSHATAHHAARYAHPLHRPKAVHKKPLTDAQKFLVDAATRLRSIYQDGLCSHQFDRTAALARAKARFAQQAAEAAAREVTKDDLDYLRFRAQRDGRRFDEEQARFKLQLLYAQQAKALAAPTRDQLEQQVSDARLAAYFEACAETHETAWDLLATGNFDDRGQALVRALFKLALRNDNLKPTSLEAQVDMQLAAAAAADTYRRVFGEQLDIDFADEQEALLDD
ncbi:hypothetical protein D3C71_328840 [compost metagenome]